MKGLDKNSVYYFMARSKKNPIHIDILITFVMNKSVQGRETRQGQHNLQSGVLFGDVASKRKREGPPDRRLGTAKLIWSYHGIGKVV